MGKRKRNTDNLQAITTYKLSLCENDKMFQKIIILIPIHFMYNMTGFEPELSLGHG